MKKSFVIGVICGGLTLVLLAATHYVPSDLQTVGLAVGPGAPAILTNVLYGSATLNFGLTTGADLPITVVGAQDGDIVSLGVPTASVLNAGAVIGTFSAFASNGIVYVRFVGLGEQDPPSGTFKVEVHKFR